MKITIQYFDGCPHWEVADRRVRKVLEAAQRADVELEYELIDSAETAARVRFHGSPTILVNGRDPFATGEETIGLTCRVYRTEQGPQGSPTEDQLRVLLAGYSPQ